VNKKQYYNVIKEYNHLLDERNFNPEFFSKENNIHFEKIRKSLLFEINKMKNAVILAINYDYSTIRPRLDKLRMLELQLEGSQKLERMHYEKSWVETELWFKFFTRKQVLIIAAVGFLLFILMQLEEFFEKMAVILHV